MHFLIKVFYHKDVIREPFDNKISVKLLMEIGQWLLKSKYGQYLERANYLVYTVLLSNAIAISFPHPDYQQVWTFLLKKEDIIARTLMFFDILSIV